MFGRLRRLGKGGPAPSPLPTKSDPESPSADVEKRSATVKSVSYFSLFRYADKWDVVCIILGTIGAVGNGVSMPLFSIIFGDILNSIGLNLGDNEAMKASVKDNIPKFLYLGVVAFFGAVLQVVFWTMASIRQVNKIRGRYLKSALHQDMAYFDTTATSGRLLQGLNDDSLVLQSAIGDKIAMFLFTISTSICGFVIAFTKDWQLTLVIMALLPVLAATGFFISTIVARLTSAMNKAFADANTLATQALSNIRTVYSFNAQPKTLTDFNACLEEPLKVGVRSGVLGGITVGLTQCTALCAYALAMWFGSVLIARGDANGGEVLNVLFAALIGGFSLGQAAPNIQYFQQGQAAGGRIFHIIQRKSLISAETQGRELGLVVQGYVEFKDVTFAYPTAPEKIVLTNFSLLVPHGHTVSLVGESGSGKSTVIGLMERFYDPQNGQILLDGVNIKELQLTWYRQQMGLVSQEPTLFASSILENIRFGKPDATYEEIEQACKAANALNFVTAMPLGLNTMVGEKGIQLSGGQKQRIAIARAILRNPKILLLDEATSALDAASEHVVQEALDTLMQGRTTIIVAHRLSTVVNSDTISVVNKGRIIEQGTHKQLMKAQGAYTNLVHLQQQQYATSPAGSSSSSPVHLSSSTSSSTNSSSLKTIPAVTAAYEDAKEDFIEVDISSAGPSSKASSLMKPSPTATTGNITRSSPTTSSPRGKRPGAAWGRAAAPVVDRLVVGRPAEAAKDEEWDGKKVTMKRLARMNSTEWPALLGGLFGSVALGLVMPIFSLAFSSLINVFYFTASDAIEAGARKWALVFVGIGFAAFFFSILQAYCFTTMGQKLARRVRYRMMESMLKQEVAWYDQEENNSGVLVGKISSDAAAVKGQYGDTMGLLTQNLVTFIAAYIIAGINSWRMMLVVTAFVPVLVLAGYIQIKLILQYTSQENRNYANANHVASEAFSGIKTITAFGMQTGVSKLYDRELEVPTKQGRRRAAASGFGFGFAQFVFFLIYAVSFWYGAILITRNQGTFEEVLKAFFAIFLAAFGMSQAQLHFPDVAKGKAATKRAFSIIDRKPVIDSSSQEGLQPLEVVGKVELRDVSFAYASRPEVKVLENFCITANANKSLALVGESGSGKSTVISLVSRFYDPQSGQVLLDNTDIKLLNLRWLRDRIALVSQEPVLFNLTVADNIRYGRPDASIESVQKAAKLANADKFIEQQLPEGLDTKLGEGGIILSGGQKQRIAIARALLKDPKILLLDEATSALDAESERMVQAALETLMGGRTTIIVAHRLSTIQSADSIAVIHRGKVVEIGNHQELIQKAGGAYSRLVQHQLLVSSS